MKLLSTLPVLAFAAVSALAPAAATAQANTVAPALYAEFNQPASSSSSSVSPFSGSASSSSSAFLYHAPSAAGAAAAPAPASEGSTKPFSSLGIGFQIGLGGIGFNAATPLIPGRLNLRGGAGFFSYTYNGTVSNEPVSATLKLNNSEIMVDLFPFKGSFRLSAGTTIYNTTGLNGTVTAASGTNVKIGSDYYLSDPSAPLTGNLAVGFGGKAVPRFTLGWGNMVPRTGHIKFETEFGVEIIGTPSVAWNYGGEACQTASSSSTSCNSESGYQSINSVQGASADIASQTADLQSDVNSVKVFPIFELGLSYKIGK